MARADGGKVVFCEDDWSYRVEFDSNHLIIEPISKDGLIIAWAKVPLKELATHLKPFLK